MIQYTNASLNPSQWKDRKKEKTLRVAYEIEVWSITESL